MFVYLINECLLAHLYLLFMLSCHCLRRCVPRLPLKKQVLRAQEGSLACLWGSRSSEQRKGASPASEGAGLQSAGGSPESTSLPVSPLGHAELWAFSWFPVPPYQLVPCAVPWWSVGTSCQHIEVTRVTSSRGNSPGINSPESPPTHSP